MHPAHRKASAHAPALPRSIVLAIALAAVAYFRNYLRAAEQPYRPFVHAALPLAATWRAECGSCHLAYHPSLLPARSWERMLAAQQEHFGEDLALEADTTAELAAFAQRHAAEALESPVAWKMASTIPPTQAPIEISATAYWQERHARLDAATWRAIRKSDCGACHLDAEAGTFEPGAIHIGAPTGTKKTK